MLKKRKDRENRIIVSLAVLSLLLFTLSFGLTTMEAKDAEKEQQTLTALKMESIVDQLYVEYGENADARHQSYGLVKRDAHWYPADETAMMDSSAVTTMIDTLKTLEVDRIIEDGRKYFETFGLDEQAIAVTIHGAGQEKTYYFGKYNAILDQNYMRVDDETWVYLIPAEQANAAVKSLYQLVSKPALCAVEANTIVQMQVKQGKEHYTMTVSGNTVVVEQEGKRKVSTSYNLRNIFNTLRKLPYDECELYDATETDKRNRGLDEPVLELQYVLTDGSRYMAKFGAANGQYYCNFDDSAVVYALTAQEFNKLYTAAQVKTTS